MRREPALPEVGVISLVPDEWDDVCMPRHQVMSRVADYFHVVWCNPAQEWRKAWLEPAPLARRDASVTAIRPGLVAFTPGRWMPVFYRPPALGRLLLVARLRRAWRLLAARGCTKRVLWLWRPAYADALDAIAHDLSVYHIDDEYSFSDTESPLDEREVRLIERVDQVFIASPAVFARKGAYNPRARQIPNGVDFHAYVSPTSEPDDLAPVPHPRIGYVGVVKKQLNLELLATMAARWPQWSFILVGPIGNVDGCETAIARLKSASNVYFLGRKPVSALPGYTQHMDVCIMPYAINDYTKYIAPLKLHEYLAAGRPIVGSPILPLQPFPHVVALAETAEDWSRALNAALDPTALTAERVAARRAVASGHDWDVLVRLMVDTVCERLGPVWQERIDRSAAAR